MFTENVPPGEAYHRAILDAIPIPIFVVDRDVRVLDFNKAAAVLVPDSREKVLRQRSGEILHCVHSSDVPEGCGRGPFCRTCIIRNSVNEAFSGNQIYRRKTQAELLSGEAVNEMDLLITTAPIPGMDDRVLLILEDVSEINKLRTLIPMCAKCRRVRNDEQYWQSVETYLRTYHAMDISHGICQECFKELYPEISDDILKKHPRK